MDGGYTGTEQEFAAKLADTDTEDEALELLAEMNIVSPIVDANGVIITDKNNYIIEINRELAIKKAFEMSIPYDTIAILGKGCEKTLEKDITVAYSDFDVIEKIKEQYYG